MHKWISSPKRRHLCLVVLLGSYVIRLSRTVYLNILPPQGESCHGLRVSPIHLICDVNSDSLQRLEVYKNVRHLLDSGGGVSYPGQVCYMMVWDILSCLRVGFLLYIVSSQPTTLCTAVNMANVFLFRGNSGSIQTIGFSSPFLRLTLWTLPVSRYRLVHRLGLQSLRS